MKSLYESILSSTNTGRESTIKAWLDEHNIKNYTINNKGEIDVDGDVHLSGLGLTEFPSFIQFGTVKGNFNCSFNNLTSLRGAPKEVGRAFDCNNNNLTTLEGAPIEAKFFTCEKNTTKFSKDDVRKVCKVKKSIYV